MSARRPVLREGSRGPSVRQLQVLLNAHLPGAIAVTIDGSFGQRTKDAVSAFQRSKNLGVDGEVGANTWRALEAHENVETLYKYTPGPQEPLADIAVPYIGATEATGNRMGTDPRMREIFEADRYSPNGATDGYAWCSAFVSLCVQKLIDQSDFHGHVAKPTTPSVSNFRTRWAPNENCLIFKPDDATHSPHKGDIVVYTFSHIGILESMNANGSLNTIEGNTSVAGSREGTTVRRQIRVPAIVRCLIRLPVPRTYDFENQMCVDESANQRTLSVIDFLGNWLTNYQGRAVQSTYGRPSSLNSGVGLTGNSCGRLPGPTGQ